MPLVLLVDDDPTTVMTLDRLLRGAGLDTLRAGDRLFVVDAMVGEDEPADDVVLLAVDV